MELVCGRSLRQPPTLARTERTRVGITCRLQVCERERARDVIVHIQRSHEPHRSTTQAQQGALLARVLLLRRC
jgi:hypothetical protein